MSIRNSRLLAALFAASMLVPSVVRAEDLAARVATKLKDSGAMSGYRVSVRSEDKTIFLEGTVGSPKQIEMAVVTAENTAGVERVVNRLTVVAAGQSSAKPKSADGPAFGLSLPSSMMTLFSAPVQEGEPAAAPVQLTQATEPEPQADEQQAEAMPEPVIRPAPAVRKAPAQAVQARKPRPLGAPVARPMAQQPMKRQARGPIARTSGMGHPSEPMIVSDVVVGEGSPMPHGGAVGNGQIVPGSDRIIGDSGAGGYAGAPGRGYAGGGMGRPLPMGAGGAGMPVASVRGEGPNMPNYAWPSYAASPNYAALQYPTQYSPTAWPYIGPFYPYPQVPLGWRRVSLEWDDGWWFLDFDDDHHRRGHHGH
jgi:hypothetical protein